MKRLTINPSNESYYSEDFIKGFEYGTQRQLEAYLADRPSGEFTEREYEQFLHGISLSLLSKRSAQHWRYDEETAQEIQWLESLEQKVRARMKGADDE